MVFMDCGPNATYISSPSLIRNGSSCKDAPGTHRGGRVESNMAAAATGDLTILHFTVTHLDEQNQFIQDVATQYMGMMMAIHKLQGGSGVIAAEGQLILCAQSHVQEMSRHCDKFRRLLFQVIAALSDRERQHVGKSWSRSLQHARHLLESIEMVLKDMQENGKPNMWAKLPEESAVKVAGRLVEFTLETQFIDQVLERTARDHSELRDQWNSHSMMMVKRFAEMLADLCLILDTSFVAPAVVAAFGVVRGVGVGGGQ